MKFSMTGQEKSNLLIQVTSCAGLTVYIICLVLKFLRSQANLKFFIINSITNPSYYHKNISLVTEKHSYNSPM